MKICLQIQIPTGTTRDWNTNSKYMQDTCGAFEGPGSSVSEWSSVGSSWDLDDEVLGCLGKLMTAVSPECLCLIIIWRFEGGWCLCWGWKSTRALFDRSNSARAGNEERGPEVYACKSNHHHYRPPHHHHHHHHLCGAQKACSSWCWGCWLCLIGGMVWSLGSRRTSPTTPCWGRTWGKGWSPGWGRRGIYLRSQWRRFVAASPINESEMWIEVKLVTDGEHLMIVVIEAVGGVAWWWRSLK